MELFEAYFFQFIKVKFEKLLIRYKLPLPLSPVNLTNYDH